MVTVEPRSLRLRFRLYEVEALIAQRSFIFSLAEFKALQSEMYAFREWLKLRTLAAVLNIVVPCRIVCNSISNQTSKFTLASSQVTNSRSPG